MHGGLYKVQMGLESVLGTEVNATAQLAAMALPEDDSPSQYPEEAIGIAGGRGRHYIPKRHATIAVEQTPVTFEQLCYFLDMGLGAATPAQDGAGSGYIYTYPFPYSASPTIDTYTFELGDEQNERLFTGCFLQSMTISGQGEQGWMYQPVVLGQPRGDTTFTAALSPPTVEDVLFARTSLYIDDVGDGFGTTVISEPFLNFSLQIQEIMRPKWCGAGSTDPYYSHVRFNSKYAVTLTFSLTHESVAATEFALRDTPNLYGIPRAIRLLAQGEDLATAGTTYSKKTIIIDLPGTYENSKYAKSDPDINTDFTFHNHYDATITNRGQIVVVNELSALP